MIIGCNNFIKEYLSIKLGKYVIRGLSTYDFKDANRIECQLGWSDYEVVLGLPDRVKGRG